MSNFKNKTNVKNISELKENICYLADKYQKDFECISDFLFNHPELGGEEFLAHEYLTKILSEHNFDIKKCKELPTAIVASYINDPEYDNFAFIAEYDALPGYGDNCDKNAHACGHNWIAATMTGCAIVLSKISKVLKINVSLIGTPAEETFGAKYDMINLCVFNNIDFALQAHLDAHNNMYVHNLAMNSLEFKFKGVASHASQSPENGVNALDAVISMFVNIGLLRQQLHPKAKIHGIITNGGSAVNIIPELAICQFSMRDSSKSNLEILKNKVINIANAAALSTGCSLEYKFIENPFDDSLHIDSMIEITEKNFNEYGICDFLKKDNTVSAGSSDIGNVSYVCPTIYAEISLDTKEPLAIHTNKALDFVNSKFAYDKINSVIKAFCCSVVDISQDDELSERIKEEFKIKTQN